MRAAWLEVDYCRLEAPWDGAVVARHVNALESVSPGQPLLEIHSAAVPRLQLFVPSGWLAWLAVGARFEVEILETGRRYPAVLKRLGTQVDAVSQTVELFGEFDGETEGLLPGMTGTALMAPPSP
ncbi:MAG: HlyD family efflux transporter periplasmic adaptor subunit [Gammaproteobacteria bacterium]